MKNLALCFLAVGLAACSSTLDVGTNQGDAGRDGTPDDRDQEGTIDQPPPPGNGDSEHGTIGPRDAKRMFVTSATYHGDLATQGNGVKAPPLNDPGIDGADKLCQAAAVGANLGGTWKAWISSYTPDQDPTATAHHAIDRIVDVPGGWYNVDRTAHLFLNKTNLTTAPNINEWRSPISHNSFVKDEHGNRIEHSAVAWTGTDSGGRRNSNYTCKGWTAPSGGYGMAGAPAGEAVEWTSSAPGQCGQRERLYCFEQ